MIDKHATLELTRSEYNALQDSMQRGGIGKPGQIIFTRIIKYDATHEVYIDVVEGKDKRYISPMLWQGYNFLVKTGSNVLTWLEGQSISIEDKDNDCRYVITLIVNNGGKKLK